MARKKKDPSGVINVADLRNINIPTQRTIIPSTPEWTDRSRNGKGFFCTQQPDEESVDWEGSGGKRYRRN
jgi:hypothetical protein